MKTPRNSGRTRRILQRVALGAAAFFFIAVAKSDPPFGLTIQVTNANQLHLTITNAVGTNFYQIDRRPAFDSEHPWAYATNGAQGQTNFTLDMGEITIGFSRATPCIDCDNDGWYNWEDADPLNSSIGQLTITIDAPTNGSIFN